MAASHYVVGSKYWNCEADVSARESLCDQMGMETYVHYNCLFPSALHHRSIGEFVHCMGHVVNNLLKCRGSRSPTWLSWLQRVSELEEKIAWSAKSMPIAGCVARMWAREGLLDLYKAHGQEFGKGVKALSSDCKLHPVELIYHGFNCCSPIH